MAKVKAYQRTHESWSRMLARCYNRKSRQYRNYGRKGVGVDPRWFDFNQFLIDMGPRQWRHGLVRLNPCADYGPGNCKWELIDRARRHDHAQVNGEPIAAIAARLKISYSTAYHRYITRGKPVP